MENKIIKFPIAAILFLIFAILISIVICYFIFLFFASFILAEPRTGTISISKELVGITKYPIDIFGSNISFVFYTFVPVGFITTVPANLLIGRISYIYLLYGLLVAALLGIISIGMWNRNLKKYSSTSNKNIINKVDQFYYKRLTSQGAFDEANLASWWGTWTNEELIEIGDN